ncbi:SAM-dependent methyltransferase [Methylopila jiangsuensis]|uniref:SAM-dependent methyltransferase n=1 Tax=Methylopila jiangsuensis TaxID=586230 RepID=A0A9W6JIM6_9HYPH|nr:class I SAM-dependent methyltransferase [Methylopila jiangsuensis]MDR6284043.1 phosphatidylethanolamine/phosphatidyl-N-methylethanolamine N-methyltransferase [Methylopila jiangsuensis]GLK76444.1 SAM-dependent methyltransferase [Methylopila jiangsuensis]
MSVRYDLEGQKKAYAKWAPIYDKVYVRLLADAQKKAAAAAAANGPDILEVGVGTGLVLRYYPRTARVVGVDLSRHMLAKAREKVEAQKLSQVRGLAAMDACHLGFPDASFDAVTVPFVITLVPDPEKALDEMRRVLKPGGEIVVASKMGADHGLMAKVETAVAPLVKQVGWSSDFKVSRLRAWAAHAGDMHISDVSPVFPAGFFKIVRIRRAT